MSAHAYELRYVVSSIFWEKFQEGAVSGLSFIIDSGAIISMVLCVGT